MSISAISGVTAPSLAPEARNQQPAAQTSAAAPAAAHHHVHHGGGASAAAARGTGTGQPATAAPGGPANIDTVV